MNTRRMNRLEELGRVDAEKADTRKGKRNLREEKARIVRELKADGGKVKKKKKKSRENPMKDDRAREGLKSKYRKMGMGKMIDSGEIDFSEYRAGGKVKKKKAGPGAASPKRRMGEDLRDKKRGRQRSFPDLTGDGKVTRADVLKGRGVFKSGGIAKRGRGCEIR